MNSKVQFLIQVELAVQAILWAVVCFSIINKFNLEGVWYLVVSGAVGVELVLTSLHQKVTFPGLISYLGYEPNQKLTETTKFRLSDHIIKIVIMFLGVYLCIKT